MAEKKTIIETCAYRTHGPLGDARKNVETGLRLAMELQDAGVKLTPQRLETLTMRSEYDPSSLRDEVRIQVPAADEPQTLVSWQTMVAAASREAAFDEFLGNASLEQLHKLRSKVGKRIYEAEKRLRDTLDETPDLGPA